jgi:predicted ATPase
MLPHPESPVQIANVLETQFPDTAETQPELLAHHCTEAGLIKQAVGYWHKTGEKAIQRSANVEAISHLNRGLDLLMALPETLDRLLLELDLLVVLGPALVATKGQGAPDVQHAYARAWELCQQAGDAPQRFQVLRGLMLYYQSRGQLQTAHQLGEQLLSLAHSQNDASHLLLAHCMYGQVLSYRGKPAVAYTHLTQALAIYNPQEHRTLALGYGIDLGVVSHSFLAWEQWQLGYPDQAIQHTQQARTLAHKVSHPFSLAQALVYTIFLHQFRREVMAAYEQAEAAIALATEQRFTLWLIFGTVFHGWALAMQGQREAGIAEVRQGLDAHLALGGKVLQLHSLGLLAETYGAGGHPEEGLPLLAEALAVTNDTEMRCYEAEIYRLKGELLLQQVTDNHTEAEACFQQALNVARRQQAKSWELRAATSLARLWQSQGKRQEAHDLLSPIYNWFTEGFDTADLQDAKTLLDELT